MRTTSMVLLILGMAGARDWLIADLRVAQMTVEMMATVSQNPLMIIKRINILLLVLGTFLDMSPLIIITTPIFLPGVTAFVTAQAFAKAAFARGAGGGAIVNIASLLSFRGGIRVPSYTASKHGVAGITKLLANEWTVKGINVTAIAPGYIATSNTDALRADPVRNRSILDRIPAGRWGEASDIGETAVFLCLPAARYIHGAIRNVDGGWLAR